MKNSEFLTFQPKIWQMMPEYIFHFDVSFDRPYYLLSEYDIFKWGSAALF